MEMRVLQSNPILLIISFYLQELVSSLLAISKADVKSGTLSQVKKIDRKYVKKIR